MFNRINLRGPFLQEDDYDFYMDLYDDHLVVSRVDRTTNVLCGQCYVDGDRVLVPLQGSISYPNAEHVQREVNKVLLFRSGVAFYTKENYGYYAQEESDGYVIFCMNELNLKPVQGFVVKEDGVWRKILCEVPTAQEANKLLGYNLKAQTAFQHQLTLC